MNAATNKKDESNLGRWNELKGIWNVVDRYIPLIIIAVVIGVLLFRKDLPGYSANLFTEGISILTTILVLDRFAKKREEELEKRQVIAAIGSQSRHFAANAIALAYEKKFFHDGSLRGQEYYRCDWTWLNVSHGRELPDEPVADWNSYEPNGCQMQDIKIRDSILSHTNLCHSHLQRAFFIRCEMDYANLFEAQLNNANMIETNLYKADLREVSLQEALLSDDQGTASFKDAILPDGTRWVEGIDMGRFTDPNHPDFYRPKGPKWDVRSQAMPD